MDPTRIHPYWVDDRNDELTDIIVNLEDPNRNKRKDFINLSKNIAHVQSLLNNMSGIDIALAYSLNDSMNKVNNESLWLSIMEAERIYKNMQN
jgi:hypothetical protein